MLLWMVPCILLIASGLLYVIGATEPWDRPASQFVDVTAPSIQMLILRAEANEAREIGSMICWSYSRDRVVERRELRLEPPDQKLDRLLKAAEDKIRALHLVA